MQMRSDGADGKLEHLRDLLITAFFLMIKHEYGTFGFAQLQEFLIHGTRDEVLEEVGLTPQHLARQITEAVALRSGEVRDSSQPAAERRPVE